MFVFKIIIYDKQISIDDTQQAQRVQVWFIFVFKFNNPTIHRAKQCKQVYAAV